MIIIKIETLYKSITLVKCVIKKEIYNQKV